MNDKRKWRSHIQKKKVKKEKLPGKIKVWNKQGKAYKIQGVKNEQFLAPNYSDEVTTHVLSPEFSRLCKIKSCFIANWPR